MKEIKKTVNQVIKRGLGVNDTIDEVLQSLGHLPRNHHDYKPPAPRGTLTTIIREIKQQRDIRHQRRKRRTLGYRCRGLNEWHDTHHARRFLSALSNGVMGASHLQRRLMQRYLDRASFAGCTSDRDRGSLEYMADYSAKDAAALIRVDSQWCQYSRNYGRTLNEKAGLVLHDPDTATLVFIRVYPSCQSVADALEYLKPAAVKRAEAQGKDVIRQGDYYLVPQRDWNLSALRGTRHEVVVLNSFDVGSSDIIIKHPQHGSVQLGTPHKAYRQIQVSNATFGRRGYAD